MIDVSMSDKEFRHYIGTKLEGYISDLHRRIDFLESDIEQLTADMDVMLSRTGMMRVNDLD